MFDNSNLIYIDFNLPNHESELCDAEEAIEKIKNIVIKITVTNTITDKLHNYYYEEVIRILDYVGKLSMPASKLNDDIERMYRLKFPKSPKLAKQLWLDHYGLIHRPYNLIKNRCFRILDELDNSYILKFGKVPPNWKI